MGSCRPHDVGLINPAGLEMVLTALDCARLLYKAKGIVGSSRCVAWIGCFVRSRLSWSGSADYWDRGVKAFACPLTPDIFGFYGDVLVPSMVLPRIVEGPLLAPPLPDGAERHASVYQMVRSCIDGLPGMRRSTFGILHAS